jgi:hypothetical protein
MALVLKFACENDQYTAVIDQLFVSNGKQSVKKDKQTQQIAGLLLLFDRMWAKSFN